MPSISTTSYFGNDLTPEEWHELTILKNAITYQPSTVHPAKMERFTELFTKTLTGKADPFFGYD